ncbi:porin [Bartonella tamiae]|uniref:Porin n=1 Tax=Bartonella tamiae Th239 TaxID=1094558 RepID=J1JYY3_9HYPH|nr:porin [Bartonella tamiae]EJF90317.1 hypothetical protein ME5_00718 [Bartonella tamiae Th239]EJF93742.1 hypothetical protein MEG_01166 [Bartonella tamiae Th307]
MFKKKYFILFLSFILTLDQAQSSDKIYLEPENIQYLKICDAYGSGYIYIPGTETCFRLSGYVRTDVKAGDNIDSRRIESIDRNGYKWRARATLRFHTATQTELGTLRTYFDLRSQWDDGYDSAGGQLRAAFIELGGLRIGMDETIFSHWTGYFGNVINGGVLDPMDGQRTNMISYTYNTSSGFSAIIGAEQGSGAGDHGLTGYTYSFDDLGEATYISKRLLSGSEDYKLNILFGLKYVQGWGIISAVGAYDTYYSEWAGKVRLDLNVTDKLLLWVMGGYKTADDYYAHDNSAYQLDDGSYHHTMTYNGIKRTGVYRLINSSYGDWGGDWALWSGSTYNVHKKASLNSQIVYDDLKNFSASANIIFTIVPGVSLTPEISYIKWNDNYRVENDAGTAIYQSSMKGKDAVQGMIRFQRSF